MEAFEMLVKGGLGAMQRFSEKETAYYKPLPEEGNKVKIASILGGKMTFEQYRDKFTYINRGDWSLVHFNKILEHSPDKTKLIHEYKIPTM